MTKPVTEPLFIRFELTALEDLHTGAGTGSGDIDALVLRDRHRKPVIRASHFKGLLREAGDELIALGKLRQDELDALLGHDVFSRRPNGSKQPRRGVLRMTSLRVPKDGLARTLVWGSSARKIDSRRPADDTLRYVEHVGAGTIFKAELRLADSALQPLLERLVRRIDRIGGHRNRGAGLVRVHWQPSKKTPRAANGRANGVAPDMDKEVARLVRAGVVPSELDRETQATIAAEERKQNALCSSTLHLVLRNLEPLCLPATGHPGNLIRSHSFIRGQALRGALMAWAIARYGNSPDLTSISIGDALPLPQDDSLPLPATVMPIPLSVLTEKPTGGDAVLPWWADAPAAKMRDSLGLPRDPRMEKPKRPGPHEYLCRSRAKDRWLRYAPRMDVRLRNQTPGRGSGADAELFSLEEIAEETRFQADIVLPPGSQDAFIDCFEPLLAGEDWLAIGRGGAPVQVDGADWWRGGEEIGSSDEWTLTLTSDLVLRDSFLGFREALDIEALCKAANVPDNEWKIADKVAATEVIHGFNAVTGLHRSPVIAIRRGSCWRITGKGSADLAKALWHKGAIGERTNEGCGRFRIGLQPVPLERQARSLSSPLERREEMLLSRAKKLADRYEAHKGPSLSQLQWLRERALASSEDQLKELLKGIKTAHTDRPQGGGAWRHFPTSDLIEELENLELKEKQHLVSNLVQWLAPKAKQRPKES